MSQDDEFLEEYILEADPSADVRQQGERWLPIVVVDDEKELGEGRLAEATGAGVLADWPGREWLWYDNLSDASAGLLPRHDPFVLVLDHDMKQPPDAELSERLGIDASTNLKGWHLAAALRRRHPLGLVLPIAYWSQKFSDPQGFLDHLVSDGVLAPSLLARKDKMDLVDCVKKLDQQFADTVEVLRSQAYRIVLDEN